MGSGLTRFALGVWIFKRTGSASLFALVAFFSTIPVILVSPFAGALVDRWDRRKAMILGDSGAAGATLLLVILVASDRLELWHIYVLSALGAAFGALQFPAFSAATTLLVPRHHLGRASGMVQLGQASARVLAPLLAGVILAAGGLGGVLAIDGLTFLLAVGVLFKVRIPHLEPAPARGSKRRSLLQEAGDGWRYIRDRPGLVRLLAFFAAVNLLTPFALVLTTPMVLAFTTEEYLGLVLGVGSAGAVLGGLLMSTWGGPERKILGILTTGPVFGLGLIVAGLRPSVGLIAAGLFVIYFSIPILNGCSQALWQVKVAPAIQGRVFAMRRVVAQVTGPVAFLLAGPLADRVFLPFQEAGGPLARALTPFVGRGPGRGIGLMFLLAGILFLLTTALATASPRLCRLEEDLPDSLPEVPAPEATAHEATAHEATAHEAAPP